MKENRVKLISNIQFSLFIDLIPAVHKWENVIIQQIYGEKWKESPSRLSLSLLSLTWSPRALMSPKKCLVTYLRTDTTQLTHLQGMVASIAYTLAEKRKATHSHRVPPLSAFAYMSQGNLPISCLINTSLQRILCQTLFLPWRCSDKQKDVPSSDSHLSFS